MVPPQNEEERDLPPNRVMRVLDVEFDDREPRAHLRDGADSVREDRAAVARRAPDVVRPKHIVRGLLAVGHEFRVEVAEEAQDE